MNESMNKKQTFLRFMRCVSVITVTVMLLAFVSELSHPDDFGPGFMLLAVACMFFYITIPLIGFWIYSFVKAIRRHTKTDKILLWAHAADLEVV